MAMETERKFLVCGDGWRALVTDERKLVQGYLAIDGTTTVRVRTDGSHGWITIKGPAEGLARPEYEFGVPAAEAKEMMSLCLGRIVEKTRHMVSYNGDLWEVDVFAGANQGLVLAELELEEAQEEFARPDWLGPEVSADPRYFNAALSVQPYIQWEQK